MSFYRIMLVTLVLLCCAVEGTSNKNSSPGRLRQLTNTIDNTFPKVNNSEERGIFSNLKTNLGDWIKTTYWTTFGKSDDYVKKKLGLQT
ncbi:RxLR effector protein, partial [Phytophthora megakarya]